MPLNSYFNQEIRIVVNFYRSTYMRNCARTLQGLEQLLEGKKWRVQV